MKTKYYGYRVPKRQKEQFIELFWKWGIPLIGVVIAILLLISI